MKYVLVKGCHKSVKVLLLVLCYFLSVLTIPLQYDGKVIAFKNIFKEENFNDILIGIILLLQIIPSLSICRALSWGSYTYFCYEMSETCVPSL